MINATATIPTTWPVIGTITPVVRPNNCGSEDANANAINHTTALGDST